MLRDRDAKYFHGPGFQILLQQKRSMKEEFLQAKEGVDYVDVPNSLQQFRLPHTHLQLNMDDDDAYD